jgi:curved DNA-binding protein
MTDYYQTLGVSESASPDEIKKAYRTLANKHHPDKGGDQAKFKDISVANDVLSDPQKRAEYDQQRQFESMHGNGTQFHFHSGNPFGGGHPFGDIFGGVGHGFSGFDIFGRQVRKNRDLNIQCQISLLDSFQGKVLEAKYQLPSGRMQTVSVSIPAGAEHGNTIRYQGLGDDSMQGAPRGNLNITILVLPDDKFKRVNDDLYTDIEITPIEAMIGCRKQVTSINGESMVIDIRSGVETGVEYASHGGGFINLNSNQKGRFVSVIKIKTPKVTDPAVISKLRQLNDEIGRN